MSNAAEQLDVVVAQEAVVVKPEKAWLKAERVQEFLRDLPGWEACSEVCGIRRLREFQCAAEAEAFAGFALKLAARRKRPVSVRLAGRQVFVTLWGNPALISMGGLTEAMFNLAGELG
jgi:hypothetical protein